MMEEKDIDYLDEDVRLMTDLSDLSGLSDQRLDAYMLVSCVKGRMQFWLNGEELSITPQTNLICLPHSHVGQILVTPDASVAVLMLSVRLVQGLLHSNIEQWNRALYVNRQTLLTSSDEHQRQMRYYYDLIRSKLCDSGQPYHQEIFRTIIRAVLFEILSLIERQSPAEEERPDAEVNRSQYHFKNFLDLLSKTQVKHQPVSYYASRLRSALPLRLSKNLTAKYLSVICKENSQKSPLDWIRDMTNEDIRHHLLATDLSIKEIANHLGFENASFFGKYVKKHFGCSPMEYRISHTNKK